MKLFITLAYSILFYLHTFSQENLFYKGSNINYCKVDSEFSAISRQPVTNREYIIYLQWMRMVFSSTFPKLYYNSIPGFNTDKWIREYHEESKTGSAHEYDINHIFRFSEHFVKNYIFNPKYLDYPVVGVSWQNANNYGKWLADRYNENKLITMGFLDFEPTPSDQDFFSTDALISGLWAGQFKKISPFANDSNRRIFVNWSDHIFIPVFRLPTENEISKTKTNSVFFKPYSFSKKNFLHKWYKHYFAAVTDSTIELWTPYGYRERITCNETTQMSITGELNLDINNKTDEHSLIEIYKQNNQLPVLADAKSSEFSDNYIYLNDMTTAFPYVIIGEDHNGKVVFVTKYKNSEKSNPQEFKVFRLACSATPKQLGLKAKDFNQTK